MSSETGDLIACTSWATNISSGNILIFIFKISSRLNYKIIAIENYAH